MTFAGLGNPEDRANIIAYMNAQGSNLPLPTPEAAPAADAATNEAAAPEAPGAGTGDANAEHGAAETGGQTAPVAPTTTRSTPQKNPARIRSEDSRGGKAGVSTGRFRG